MASVLFLSQALPFPPDSGGTQRTYHVLRELQREFDVRLVSFSRREHQPNADARREAETALAERLTRVYPSVRYPAEWSVTRRAWDHGRALLASEPYCRFQHGVDEFGERIDEALSDATPDLVHFDTIDLHPWFDRFRGIPATCTHHDIESHLLARRAGTVSNPLTAAYIRHQATLMRQLEARLCPRFEMNLTMSELDSQRLREIAPGSVVAEAPNAVALDDFPLPPEEDGHEDAVVFVGPTYLFANEDAAEFLLGEIWPLVRRRRPGARLRMIGKNTPEQRERYARIPGVEPLGWVESIQGPVGRSACSVIPIRVGGGTRIKILESWALGRAVVTTTLGGEGLAVVDGRNAFVRDDAEGFADAIVRVLEDRELRRSLGREGRRTVEERYDWRAVGRDLCERYRAIIEAHRRRKDEATAIPPGRGRGWARRRRRAVRDGTPT